MVVYKLQISRRRCIEPPDRGRTFPFPSVTDIIVHSLALPAGMSSTSRVSLVVMGHLLRGAPSKKLMHAIINVCELLVSCADEFPAAVGDRRP